VDVSWTADDYDRDELNFPTEDGATTISVAIGSRVLWNKADIAFEKQKPASKPSQPSSPPGDPSDDDDDNGGDDNGGDSNDNVGGQGSPRCSTPPNTSNPEGGMRGAPSKETPPPSGPKGTGQCPPAPKKQTDIYPVKPAHLATEQWATYNIVEDFKYKTAFDRYTMANLCVQVYSYMFLFELMILTVMMITGRQHRQTGPILMIAPNSTSMASSC
jgi:hypothetical protein